MRASHLLGIAPGLVLALALTSAATAATASYEYDALGRLTRIDYSDGKRVIYRLDAAGNRTQVTSGTLAGVPASITVPPGSTSGSYTISWGASTGRRSPEGEATTARREPWADAKSAAARRQEASA